MGEVIRLKQWFMCNNIKVPDEWVVACIGWIRSEEGNRQLTQEMLQQSVWEQWLVSDLCDLECPCLPQGLMGTERSQLTGSYALQVQSLRDISKPAYSQLIKLRGTENENVNVTASTQREPEQKACRVLLLSLTDGVTTVQAMEYKPIPVLQASLPPGTKVMLSGSMELRVGILMITSDNIKVLGGDVEALKEPNKQERVLEKALIQDDPTPINFRPNWNIPVYQPRFSKQSGGFNQQRQNTGGPNYNQDLSGNYIQRPNYPQQMVQRQVVPRINNDFNQNNSFPDDDFPDDDEIDFASLETVDYQVPPQPNTQRPNYQPQVSQQGNQYRENYPSQTAGQGSQPWGGTTEPNYNQRTNSYNQGYNQNMVIGQNSSFPQNQYQAGEFNFSSMETVNYQQQMSHQGNRMTQQSDWMQSQMGHANRMPHEMHVSSRMPHEMAQANRMIPHEMGQANRMPHEMGQQYTRMHLHHPLNQQPSRMPVQMGQPTIMQPQMGVGYNQQMSGNQDNSFADENFPDDDLFGDDALWDTFDENQ